MSGARLVRESHQVHGDVDLPLAQHPRHVRVGLLAYVDHVIECGFDPGAHRTRMVEAEDDPGDFEATAIVQLEEPGSQEGHRVFVKIRRYIGDANPIVPVDLPGPASDAGSADGSVPPRTRHRRAVPQRPATSPGTISGTLTGLPRFTPSTTRRTTRRGRPMRTIMARSKATLPIACGYSGSTASNFSNIASASSCRFRSPMQHRTVEQRLDESPA